VSNADPTLAEVRALRAEVNRVLALLTGIAVRKESRAEQARRLGVHPTTLWRRQKRTATKLSLEGRV
jgi:hypothetical protein